MLNHDFGLGNMKNQTLLGGLKHETHIMLKIITDNEMTVILNIHGSNAMASKYHTKSYMKLKNIFTRITIIDNIIPFSDNDKSIQS